MEQIEYFPKSVLIVGFYYWNRFNNIPSDTLINFRFFKQTGSVVPIGTSGLKEEINFEKILLNSTDYSENFDILNTIFGSSNVIK